MSEDWLEIPDQEIDVKEIMQRIRERVAERQGGATYHDAEALDAIADATREQTLGAQEGISIAGKRIPIWQNDCDIVPRHYVIDWRIPILGPIHALVRRVINDEIRRYLMRSLEKQAHLNRKMLQALQELAQENAYLRQEIIELSRKE